MSSRFFYTFAAAGIFGVAMATQFLVTEELVAAMLVVALVAGVLWRFHGSAQQSPLLLVSAGFMVFALSLAYSAWRVAGTDTVLNNYFGEEVVLEGIVVREPDVRSQLQLVTIREPISNALVQVSVDRNIFLHYGDLLVATGELTAPESFTTEFGRTFQYPEYLKARGIVATLPFAEVEVAGRGLGNPGIAKLLAVKHWFMGEIESVIPEPQAGLGEGLLLGVKRALGSELETIFRVTGIIHIVVLSGYNVMLVAEAIMRLLALVFPLRTRVVIGIVAIASFALLVGLSATVVRASIMAGLVLYARAFGRHYQITRALVIAGMIMIFVNPYILLYDPGFQLSFLATLGLILVAPLIEERLALVPTRLQIREFITATIATQIMVLPLLLFSIGQVSLVAVIVNVLVLPMVPIAMLLSFITGLSAGIPGLGVAVAFMAHLTLSYITFIPSLFATLPFAAVVVPPFGVGYVFALYMALFVCVYYLRGVRVHPHPESAPEADLAGWTIETHVPKTAAGKPTAARDEMPFR